MWKWFLPVFINKNLKYNNIFFTSFILHLWSLLSHQVFPLWLSFLPFWPPQQLPSPQRITSFIRRWYPIWEATTPPWRPTNYRRFSFSLPFSFFSLFFSSYLRFGLPSTPQLCLQLPDPLQDPFVGIFWDPYKTPITTMNTLR